jgi:hypothetical protein
MDEQTAKSILQQLERIAQALDTLARVDTQTAPNYIKPLDAYRGFDWAGIGASVVGQDVDGPTHLEWGGALWTRRSPSNKYDPAIWFSRPAGRDEEGNIKYLRLITFKPVKDAEPLPEKTAAAAGKTNGKLAPQTHTGKTGPLPAAPVSWAEFSKLAAGLNIKPEASVRIASLLGLESKSPDLAKALPVLNYFSQAKRLGLDWAASLAILQESVMDTGKAGQILDKQHTPPGK